MITKLEKRHKDLLLKEFGIDDVDTLDDEKFDDIYERLFEIELDEFSDSDESERGDIAVEIIDYMADQFEDDDNGYFKSDEFKEWALANGFSDDQEGGVKAI
jgi:hypothetical protein